MNHEQRRDFKKYAIAKLKEAKGFLLITTDGRRMPIHFYDLSNLNKDDTDIRVIAMQNAVGASMEQLALANGALEKRIQQKKIDEAKAKLTGNTADSDNAVVLPPVETL